MTRNENNYIKRWAKKIKAIEYLGGKCSKCGNDNIFVLSFHHINPNEKEKNINDLTSSSWSVIEKEIKKCILLCENCHREEHYIISDTHKKGRINKKIYLEYKNIYECSKCGYDKCVNALEFHHINENNKDFNIGNATGKRFKTVNDLEERIKDELDKCDVLCANCHRLDYNDKIKFDKLKDLIYNKEIKENKKIDVRIIKNMMDSGMTWWQIAKELSVNKTTIYYISKRINEGASSNG